MNDKVTYAMSEASDAHALAGKLRAADLREVEASDATPLEALLRGLRGWSCITVFVGPEPVAMFGVDAHPDDPRIGVIWFLGSDKSLHYPRRFLRDARRFLDAYQAKFPVLGNRIHAKNTAHIRWLNQLGFTVWREGASPFRLFSRKLNV